MTELMNVESSMFTQLGYDERHRALTVRFTSGHLYQYHEVPETVWNELQAAYSMGSYFSKNIRDAYRYDKLEG